MILLEVTNLGKVYKYSVYILVTKTLAGSSGLGITCIHDRDDTVVIYLIYFHVPPNREICISNPIWGENPISPKGYIIYCQKRTKVTLK